MNLQRQNDTPGLWVNPAWQEGTAGTFAVVIGVSQYPHLDCGAEPAQDFDEAWIQEAKGLGQLKVSALTAFELFQWLAQAYRFDAAPIAKCWLLLSPTDLERQNTPDVDGHLERPTLGACQKALRAWRATIQRLPKEAQRDSRTLFFFSGHGLQVTHERQVLLPCDYLGGDAPNWNDALSTYNLRFGLESLEVPHRFYFVDACRNDFPEIRGKEVRGLDVLPENEDAYAGIRAAAILYATSTSKQAWQPDDPSKGISLYGRALLDGLRGQPDIELKAKNGLVTVGFNKLEGFVAERIVALLKNFQSSAQQPVQPSGIVRDEVVTEIDRGFLAGSRPEVTVPPGGGPGGTMVDPDARSSEERSQGVEGAILETLPHARSVDPAVQRGVWADDFNIGHDLFGSELVTEIWSNRLRVFALGNRSWLERDQLVLQEVRHDDDTRHYLAELAVDDDDPLGHWIQMVDLAEKAHGCVLPSDRFGRPRYTLELELEGETGDRGTIARLEARLSDDSPGPQAAAARLWRRYRNADVGDAVSAFELSELEGMVREKLDSPIAATVAALILLRAHRMDLLHYWLKNLADWIDELPDGPVLWAEQVMRQEQDRELAFAQAAEYLGLILERGIPYTSETLSYAASLLDRLNSIADQIPEDSRDRLHQVQQTVQSALRYFQPGGLFTNYAHFDPAETPPVLASVALLDAPVPR